MILVVPSPRDEELVITGGDGAARPLAQAGDERPGVGQKRIAVHGMHGTTWGERGFESDHLKTGKGQHRLLSLETLLPTT